MMKNKLGQCLLAAGFVLCCVRYAEAVGATTTSSTIPDVGFRCPDIEIRLFDPVRVRSVTLQMDFEVTPCESTVPGATLTFSNQGPGRRVQVDFQVPFRGPGAILNCSTRDIFHPECNPSLNWIVLQVVSATDAEGEEIEPPAICASRMICEPECNLICGDCGPDFTPVCGDADDDREIRARDALAVLQAAVLEKPCEPVRCDTDRNGSVTSTDALAVLRAAIGADVTLLCPAPCTFAFD